MKKEEERKTHPQLYIPEQQLMYNHNGGMRDAMKPKANQL